jgi:hypothetical protein
MVARYPCPLVIPNQVVVALVQELFQCCRLPLRSYTLVLPEFVSTATTQRLLVEAVMNPSSVRRPMMMKKQRTMRKRQKTRLTSLR